MQQSLRALLTFVCLGALVLAAHPASGQGIKVRNGSTLRVQNSASVNLQGDTLDLGGPGATARLDEQGAGRVVNGVLTATRSLDNPSSVNVAGLGATITASATLGDVTVTRTYAVQTGLDGSESIERYYEIIPSGTNTGLDATLTLAYDDVELGSLVESKLKLFQSTDGGSTWTRIGRSAQDVAADTVQATGIRSFDRWTLGVSLAPVFVDADATGDVDGSTWTHAFTDLQTAISSATGTEELWVAAGSYTPDTETDSFVVTGAKDSLKIYGGFEGTESTRSARDPEANVTVLSGDVGNDDDTTSTGVTQTTGDINGANASHVLFLNGTTNAITKATVIDGVTVTAGRANSGGTGRNGAGLYCDGEGGSCNPILSNIRFIGNEAVNGGGVAPDGTGGAIFNRGGDFGVSGEASPTVVNAEFRNNEADGASGGAIYNWGNPSAAVASPTIENTEFIDNTADGAGGAIYNSTLNGGTTRPTIIGSWFENNEARGGEPGGAIANIGDGTAETEVISSVFLNNQSYAGGGAIGNSQGSGTATVQVTNSSFYGNVENGNGNDGGAIRNNASSIDSGTFRVSVDNSILWNNEEEIYVDGGSVTVSHSIVQNSGGSANWTGPGTDNGGNLDADPLFLDPANGNVRLNWASPAIEAGANDSVSVTTDVSGASRVQGVDVDMGAYEGGDAPSTPVAYVDTAGTDADSAGGSWSNAYHTLQAGLIAARNRKLGGTSIDEIRVAQGRYYPDEGPGVVDGDSTASFRLVPGTDVRGGYPTGGGTRDTEATPTILSGDIGQNDSDPDGDGIIASPVDVTGNNSVHVVSAQGVDAALVDGFVVTAGQADGGPSTLAGQGGGIYMEGSFPTLQNLHLQGNSAAGDGGGIHIRGVSGVQVRQTTLWKNRAGQQGGGLFATGSDVSLERSQVQGNRAGGSGGGVAFRTSGDGGPDTLRAVTLSGNSTAGEGGGLWAGGTEPSIVVNSVFTGNEAPNGGGLHVSTDTATTVTNSTFSNNVASNAGGGVLVDSTLKTHAYLQNTILWGNNGASGSEVQIASDAKVSFSAPTILEGAGAGLGGTGTVSVTGDTVSVAPMFVDADGADGTPGTLDDDLRLNWASPAIDEATQGALLDASNSLSKKVFDLERDRAGVPRAQNRVDLGAYEGGGAPRGTDVLYVDAANGTDADSSGGSWNSPYRTMQAALAAARNAKLATSGVPFREIRTAEGTYYPDEGPVITEDNRTVSFELVDSVAVYGGFQNGESFSERNPDPYTNGTVLSGDITQSGDSTGNSYNVVVSIPATEPVTRATVLDGFRVEGGNTVAKSGSRTGGGIRLQPAEKTVQPTLRNLLVADNYAQKGAGLWVSSNVFADAQPLLSDVSFVNNEALGVGGGAAFRGSSLTMEASMVNLRFLGNQAQQAGAYAVTTESGGTAAPKMANVLMSGNRAKVDSAAVLFQNATNGTLSPRMVNATWAQNQAEADSLAELIRVRGESAGTDVRIANSILWGNAARNIVGGLTGTVTIAASVVEGGWSGSGSDIIDADPRYANPDGPDGTAGTADDSLQVLGTSPALNQGDEGLLPPDVADLDADGDSAEAVSRGLGGDPRVQTGRVDAGAYEGGASPSVGATAVTNVADSSADLTGSVVPYASSASAAFEVEPVGGGTTKTYSTSVSGTDSVNVTLTADGLQPVTEYNYRLVADDGGRSTTSPTGTFKTSVSPPTATADAATSITDSSATLNGTVNPGGDTVRVYVTLTEMTTGDSTIASVDTLRTNLRADQAVAESTPDTLLPGTEYRYRIVAAREADSVASSPESFVTPPSAPVATTDSATGITDTSATLHGTVNPGGGSTEVGFRYYPTDTPSQVDTIQAVESPVDSTADRTIRATADGLQSGTEYAFATLAGNAVDTTQAPSQTFSTLTVTLTAERDTHRIGAARVGRAVRQAEVRVRNDGEATLTNLEARLIGAQSGDFETDGFGGEGSLASGEARTAQVSFAPSETGERAARLAVHTAEGGRDTTRIVGRGVRLRTEAPAVPRKTTAPIDVIVDGGFAPSMDTLYVRKGGATDYRGLALNDVSEEGTASLRLRGEVPSELVTRHGVDFYAELVGRQSDTVRVPETGIGHLPVQFDSLAAPIQMRPERYRMVTVPAAVEGGTKAALRGAYGAYDRSVWRAMQWQADAQTYREYPDLDSLTAGEAFWLITEEGEAPVVGPGQTVKADTSRTIALQAGWNQVGSPFGYAVPWSAVKETSGLDAAAVDGPVGYSDSTGYTRTPTTLRPWRGYFVFSAEADTLVVPPTGAGEKQLRKKRGPAALAESQLAPRGRAPENGAATEGASRTASNPSSVRTPASNERSQRRGAPAVAGEESDVPARADGAGNGTRAQTKTKKRPGEQTSSHTLRIEARAKTGDTDRVWIGLREGAKAGRDSLDFAQVPPLGQRLRLSVPEEVAGRSVAHAGSFKPRGGDGRAWTLTLSNRGKTAREVQMRFRSEGTLPENFNRYVLDLGQERRIAPGTNLDLKEGESRSLKVILGTESFAKAESESIELNTFTNELRGNYPNPFGQETTIAYTLETEQAVTVEIYNVLGQRVRRLVTKKKQEAGLHRLQWGGKNRYGSPVGSGVYFYRIDAENFTETRKMVLVR